MSIEKKIVISMIRVVLEKEHSRRNTLQPGKETFNNDKKRQTSLEVDEDDIGALKRGENTSRRRGAHQRGSPYPVDVAIEGAEDT